MSKLCDLFIHILEYWCKDYEGYAALNIFLFVLAEPSLIILFIMATIQCANTKNEKLKKRWKIAAYIILIAFVTFMTLLTVVPIIKDPAIREEFTHYFSFNLI